MKWEINHVESLNTDSGNGKYIIAMLKNYQESI